MEAMSTVTKIIHNKKPLIQALLIGNMLIQNGLTKCTFRDRLRVWVAKY